MARPPYYCAICQQRKVSPQVKVCGDCVAEFDMNEEWAREAIKLQDAEYRRTLRDRLWETPLDQSG